MMRSEFLFDQEEQAEFVRICGSQAALALGCMEYGVNKWLVSWDSAPALRPGGRKELLEGLARTLRGLDKAREALAEINAGLGGCDGTVREALAEYMAARGDFGKIDPELVRSQPEALRLVLLDFLESKTQDGRLPFDATLDIGDTLDQMRSAADGMIQLKCWAGRPPETLRRELMVYVASVLDVSGIPLLSGRAQELVKTVLSAVSKHAPGLYFPGGGVVDLLATAAEDLEKTKTALNPAGK